LQQNAFSKYDKYCPFYKSVEMLKNIVQFHKSATAAIERTAAGNTEGQKVTYNVIKQRLGDVLSKISSQKFEDPGATCRILTSTPSCSVCSQRRGRSQRETCRAQPGNQRPVQATGGRVQIDEFKH